MTTQSPKLLLIGLDGATFDLLQPYIDQGYLPHLANLQANGCWGELCSTVPPFTAAAWSSVITGCNPGQHGILSFTTRDRFNYDLTGKGFVNASRFKQTLWELMSEAGKQVGVVNVPLTYPARPVNGYMVTGMLTPPDAPQFTYPPDLAAQLGADYQIDVEFIRDEVGFRLHNMPPKADMMSQIRRVTAVRTQTALRLLTEKPWDFFMMVYTGTDRLAHFFWDDMMAAITEDNLAGSTPMQQQACRYLQEVDAGIGQLIAQAGPDTNIMIISDHGFGAAPTQRIYLNVWLEAAGFLQRRPATGLSDWEYWRVQIGRNKWLKQILRQILPQSVQDKTKEVAESASEPIFDWAQTKAYGVPIYFHVCGIEVNLLGRQREGCVPVADYEALRQQIIDEAQQLRHPATGQPLVQRVARREELYQGEYVETFPDVILVFDPDLVAAFSVAGSQLVEPHPHPIRPGEHRDEGLFMAAGPLFEPQSTALTGLNLIDVPATVLHSLGLPVPPHFDGRVLTEIFDPDWLAAHPVVHDNPPVVWHAPDVAPDVAQAQQPSAMAEAALEKRLRGLGYID